MKTALLSHRDASSPVSLCPTAAYLPSGNPRAWLREARQLRETTGQVPRIFLVPQSNTDLRPAGALLVVNSEAPFGEATLGLREPLPNVFILADSELTTLPAEHEVAHYFPHQYHLILPQLGMVGFGKEDALRPAQLLEISPSEFEWTLARMTPPPAPLLSAFQVPLPDEDELPLLDSDEQKIGDLRKQNKKLPGADSPLGQLGKVGGDLAKGAAALGLLGLIPVAGLFGKALGGKGGANGPTPLDKMQEWAEKNWKNISDARQKELNRLLEMMDKNPNEALRYAIPLSGFEGRRGKSNPGWKLTPHSLSLGGQQGGHAVDGWDIGYQHRLALERKYREAAANETAAGNHERAAYIHGELLGDWASAARSLTAAGMHRQATAIYLNKLKNPHLAAKALEEIGLLDQAAEQYLQARNFEKAGDLFSQLEDSTRARRCYQKAIEESRDPIVKSRLYLQKLDEPEAAIRELKECWRRGHNVAPTLREHLNILRTLEREEEALLLLDRLEKPLKGMEVPAKADLALTEKNKWKNEKISTAVDELLLRFTAEALEKRSDSKSSKQLLNLLPKILPSDPLLARDTQRFKSHKQKPATVNLEKRTGVLEPSKLIPTPSLANWNSLSPVGRDKVSLVGNAQGRLAIAEMENELWETRFLTVPFPRSNKVTQIGVSRASSSANLIHSPHNLKVFFQGPNTKFDLSELENVLGVGPCQQGGFNLLQYTTTQSLVLLKYDAEGMPKTTVALDLTAPEVANEKWLLAEGKEHLVIASSGFLSWMHSDGTFQGSALHAEPTSLGLSPSYREISALITTRDEVILSIPAKKSNRPPSTINLHCNSGGQPLACFTNDGCIVIVDGKRGYLYHSSNYAHPAATLVLPQKLGNPEGVAALGARGFVVLGKQQLALFE
ncbi:hypothetical protein AAFN60_11685 [Roseibacillus persicicus]|uniref:hypothetical protein n=1 Tax=Roseibacillus persicicus TaxID=454148 RepID=UPI00398A650F